MKKIGIMGGTFDPVHMGHLFVANEVLNIYGLDEIIFIPAGNPPHKRGTAACSYDRYIMTQLATLSNDRFTVSDIEIKKEEKSYTLKTMLEFKQIYPKAEFYFITGTDAVIDLPSWHNPGELLKICRFIAVLRPGNSLEDAKTKIEEINRKYNGHIELYQAPMLQISSTDIRSRFKNGMSARYLLPESVEQYILKHRLYLETENEF